MSRRAQGYATIDDPRLPRLIEMDTFTCCHCNKVEHMHNSDGTKKPPDQIGGYCLQCKAMTCAKPECNDKCTPFERVLETWERKGAQRSRLFREMGIEE